MYTFVSLYLFIFICLYLLHPLFYTCTSQQTAPPSVNIFLSSLNHQPLPPFPHASPFLSLLQCSNFISSPSASSPLTPEILGLLFLTLLLVLCLLPLLSILRTLPSPPITLRYQNTVTSAYFPSHGWCSLLPKLTWQHWAARALHPAHVVGTQGSDNTAWVYERE